MMDCEKKSIFKVISVGNNKFCYILEKKKKTKSTKMYYVLVNFNLVSFGSAIETIILQSLLLFNVL